MFQNKKISLLRTLVSIAKLRNPDVYQEDYSFLLLVADKAGVDRDDVEKMISRSKNVEVSLPRNNKDRFDYIYQIAYIVASDDLVDSEEFDGMVYVIEKLGVDKIFATIYARYITTSILNKIPQKEIYDKMVENNLV
jgi:hypothetical protein